MENGVNSCPQSKCVEESVLHEAICRGLTKCIPNDGDVKKLIETMLAYATSKDEMLLECQSIENSIKDLQEKATEAEEMCIKTEGSKQPYMEQIKKYYASISRLHNRAKEIKEQMKENVQLQSEMNQIRNWLDEEEISFSKFDDDVVRYLVESIRVTDNLQLIINLKGGVAVTEELYLKKSEFYKKLLIFCAIDDITLIVRNDATRST